MTTVTPSQYVKSLKDCAARRTFLSNNERKGMYKAFSDPKQHFSLTRKIDVLSAFFNHIDNFDGNLLSNSVWSLGTPLLTHSLTHSLEYHLIEVTLTHFCAGILEYSMRDFQLGNVESLSKKIETICRTSCFDNIDVQKLISGNHSLSTP